MPLTFITLTLATLTSNGPKATIEALKEGTVIVTATSVDNPSVTATCTITINAKQTTPTDPDDDKPSSSKGDKPSSDNKPEKICDVNDLNCDGVITCEELLGKYWNWDEVSKSCIYTKQVVTDSIIVNTSTK